MEPFAFSLPTNLIMGKERYDEVGEHCAKLGKKVLLHYGGGSIKRNGVYDRVVASLKAAGLEIVELGGVKPNPRVELVREGIELCKKEGVDMVLAVGGGSVIDSGKGIAVGALTDIDIWDYYCGKVVADKALPVGVVLTIPAAGSECSPVTVVTKMDTHDKRSFHNDLVIPRFAIVAPDVFTTLPKHQIANATIDVISHTLERFFSDSTGVTLMDRFCIATVENAMQQGLYLYDYPDDVDAWADFALTATVAQNGFLGQGRKEDWGTHGIGHEMSSFYDMAHGASLAIATPAWMRYVSKEKPARFVQFAREIMHIYTQDEQQAIEMSIKDFEAFCHRLGLATTLTEAGIPDADIKEMAKSVVKYRSRGQFKVLKEEDCLAIYELAL